MNNKKVIVVVLALAAALIIAIAAALASKNNSKTSEDSTAVQTQTASPQVTAGENKDAETDLKKGEVSETEVPQNESSSNINAETEKVTPTFMYFISASDAEFEKTNEMIKELKSEYDGRVNFDIVNVDETPEAKTNFPVDGQTPALIMLNTSNDISGLEFKCSDKERLVKDIENALK